MTIQITEFNETKVAVLEHRGAVELLNDSISLFIEWRKQSKLSPVATSKTYGVAYDDPKATEPENFRFDICGSIKTDVPSNPQGVITSVIPAGRCALLRHCGSHDDMDAKVYHLYGKWLPTSGEELRDFPCFFHYLNFFPEVPEHELITDIYLPLK
jgi:AraC family transcriptional regulator